MGSMVTYLVAVLCGSILGFLGRSLTLYLLPGAAAAIRGEKTGKVIAYQCLLSTIWLVLVLSSHGLVFVSLDVTPAQLVMAVTVLLFGIWTYRNARARYPEIRLLTMPDKDA